MPPLPQYLLASRQGLYQVSRAGARLLRPGRFFGIVVQADAVFAFLNRAPEGESDGRSGCIVRFAHPNDFYEQ